MWWRIRWSDNERLLVEKDEEVYALELVTRKTEGTGSEDVPLRSEASASQRVDI
jgi:hypothetical protein